jgi:hypothetical protein
MAKRKRSKAARRMYAIGRGAGLKSSGINLASGAATGLVTGMVAERSDFMRSKWFISPLAAAVGGHFLKSVNRDMGSGIVGAAGAIAYYNYKLAKGNETKGVQDTGDVYDTGDYVSMFNSLPETTGIQDSIPSPSRRPMSSVAGLQG